MKQDHGTKDLGNRGVASDLICCPKITAHFVSFHCKKYIVAVPTSASDPLSEDDRTKLGLVAVVASASDRLSEDDESCKKYLVAVAASASDLLPEDECTKKAIEL